ncbi:MAG TPA: LON peptidase substrate-binding domain-containing protein [Burkholderiales bacterium]|nr:LON peptidase substrate-binding domain-containing protein [Burkholderiales bacterium]
MLKALDAPLFVTLSIPLFPLNTVLYPGSLLPLKIFEQRYLEMTKACVRDGSPFGVCRIREGQEVGTPASTEQVGCTASIIEWDMPHIGLFHLRTRGERPFRILERSTRPDGLIRADIEWLEDTAGEIPAEAYTLCRRVLEQVVEKIGADYFPPPLAFDDPRWVSYRLAEVLPLAGDEKQSLLELRDDGARLARLHACLRRTA